MTVQLYNDDCFNIFKSIEDNSIDLILCDLPYGLSRTKKIWDCVLPLDKLWEEYNRIIKSQGNIVLFSSGLFTIDLINSNRKQYKYKLIWKKNTASGMGLAKYRPMNYYEEICVFNNTNATYNPQMKLRENKAKHSYKYNHSCSNSNHVNFKNKEYKYNPDWVQPSNVLEFNTVPNRNGKLHPTQKPVDLCEWLIKTYSNENEIVLDNCMGSGTTGVACVQNNRSFIGIEIDENYFNIAEQRIRGVLNESNR
jgi:site-specific DNA-methyltransferase (adenine-specific)